MTRTACRPAGTMRRTAAARPAVRATGAAQLTMTRTAIPATRGTATLATGVTARVATGVTATPDTGATVRPATAGTATPDTGGRTSPERTISPGGSAAGCATTVLALRLAMRRVPAGRPLHRAPLIAATRAAAAGRTATDLMAMRVTVTRAALAAAAISTVGPRPATGAAQGSLKTGRLRCQVLTTETWAVAAVLAGRTVLAGQGGPGGAAAAAGRAAADGGPAAWAIPTARG